MSKFLTKLNYEKATKIRLLFKQGQSVAELANLYNVAHQTIQDILCNKSWRDDKYMMQPVKHPSNCKKKIISDFIDNMLNLLEKLEKDLLNYANSDENIKSDNLNKRKIRRPTYIQADNIRKDWNKGEGVSISELATKYSLSEYSVLDIIRNKTFRISE